VYQPHFLEKWNPQSPAYGRFWIDVQSGERRRKTVSLGRCATQSIARLRLRDYIERAGINATSVFGQVPVPGTTFRQQAERWIDSVSIRKRRPVKPATIYGWQHCLDKWIRVAASGKARRIPRVPPLPFCGTPQGGGAGRPHQTVAGAFTKLDRPLRGPTAVRRDLSEGMVRESWFGI
jgi:hypothetical protein